MSLNSKNLDYDDSIGTMMTDALHNNDIQVFMGLLALSLASQDFSDGTLSSYDYFETIFFVMFMAMSCELDSKPQVIDHSVIASLVNYPSFFLFSAKLDKSAEEALCQLNEMQYYQRFVGKRKHIIMVGISFNSEKRQINNWSAVELTARGEFVREILPLSQGIPLATQKNLKARSASNYSNNPENEDA